MFFFEIITFLKSNNPKKSVPDLFSSFNLFLDKDGIIRIKSKFKNLDSPFSEKYPILLHNNCKLTKTLILDFHVKFNHIGLHSLIVQLRKNFWILKFLSTIKSALKSCSICSFVNGRNLKVNQNVIAIFV